MERAALVIDVTDQNFESEVVQRSFSTPVVVDFWAEWCGPCRQLGPILEKLTEEHQGEFILAKLDVDANPEVAASFGIRSMPTVVGLRDGKPVSAFQGLIPEADVRRFLTQVLPSEADELVVEAETFAAAGQLDAAKDRLHAALDKEARHPRALFALAKLDIEAGETEQGLRLLERIPPDSAVSRDAERLAAEVRTRQQASGVDLGALRARLEAAPDDLQARLELGQSLSAAGQYEEALQALLEVVERDRRFADEAARKAMLDIFDVLGAQHPQTLKYRADLAKILFR